jgi:hypothetical protein
MMCLRMELNASLTKSPSTSATFWERAGGRGRVEGETRERMVCTEDSVCRIAEETRESTMFALAYRL